MSSRRHLAKALAITLAVIGGLMVTGRLLAQPADYVVHEWGTFTSVSGSDGVRLPGVQHEEETLPSFVREMDGLCRYMEDCGKGYGRPLHNVTVKLETPVLYFYSDTARHASVSVGFKGGSISQWYPQRSGGETPPELKRDDNGNIVSGGIDFAQGYHGAIRWDVDVLPPGAYSPATVLDGDETPAWIYPRLTDSNLVTTGDGRHEKYLFYRGVGNFDLPMTFQMPDDGTLRIRNTGTDRVPFLLVYDRPEPRYHDDGTIATDEARFLAIPGLDVGADSEVHMRDLERPAHFQMPVLASLQGALKSAGLYQKEADAMIQTWWRSYFKTPGRRVFWVVPRAFTDQTLPLTLEPTPKSVVRVMVGRAELLTPSFERQLLEEYRDAESKSDFHAWDRFGPAYAARMEALEAAK